MLCRQHLFAVLNNWLPGPEIGAVSEVRCGAGLSGALLWRVECNRELLLLRAHPEAWRDQQHRLLRIHRFQQELASSGPKRTPCPRVSRAGETLVPWRGRLWELSDWIAGRTLDGADLDSASSCRLFRFLADVHVRAANCRAGVIEGVSPGLTGRAAEYNRLQRGGIDDLANALVQAASDAERSLAAKALEQLRRAMLRLKGCELPLAGVQGPLQWCLRDVRPEHFVVAGDRVVGMVDFGAAEVEHVACDLARLLSECGLQGTGDREVALDAYQQVRPLSQLDVEILEAFWATGTLLATANWVKWLLVEGRWQDDRPARHLGWQRLSVLTQRLERLSRC